MTWNAGEEPANVEQIEHQGRVYSHWSNKPRTMSADEIESLENQSVRDGALILVGHNVARLLNTLAEARFLLAESLSYVEQGHPKVSDMASKALARRVMKAAGVDR